MSLVFLPSQTLSPLSAFLSPAACISCEVFIFMASSLDTVAQAGILSTSHLESAQWPLSSSPCFWFSLFPPPNRPAQCFVQSPNLGLYRLGLEFILAPRDTSTAHSFTLTLQRSPQCFQSWSLLGSCCSLPRHHLQPFSLPSSIFTWLALTHSWIQAQGPPPPGSFPLHTSTLLPQ